ncbi:enamine deaminase RidA (YjgF/YER057c/UK114 family) [Pseudoxanthomonas sp. SORGH_AS 997]|uniref:Enamine deaminase RidA (YjgF/YER057c/UK114 family) n=1 Tax=Pseudoxanthomonas winnipegensis TaxID=2480810 RepID=A0AAW8GCF0_9GAMM|nr:enamine deaminase RidA (YjgF/YER057c/UK114 family) [Pseudoxanthomonas winnipegensis]MDQ1133310.1 enamine deaminase RidA (YjgF/YER057c/UK114 family) [Pseudoxanthomonas winnipegensis]MDR6140444.1 enamine deaminase RidA (YjgF/YER057c/UK114 family) [Pseudoxanthomonas sp. SORGH_AS_0997]
MTLSRRLSLFLLAAPLALSAHAADVKRYAIPGSDFPIASAVEIPAGKTTIYLSGKVPAVADPAAPKDSMEAFGDTKTQTISVLTQIKQQLEGMGLGMKDVVKMQVFLVGGPENGGKMDFKGFMEGYTQFFGKEAKQMNLPARSAFQIAALGNPGMRIEIEVVAVRP